MTAIGGRRMSVVSALVLTHGVLGVAHAHETAARRERAELRPPAVTGSAYIARKEADGAGQACLDCYLHVGDDGLQKCVSVYDGKDCIKCSKHPSERMQIRLSKTDNKTIDMPKCVVADGALLTLNNGGVVDGVQESPASGDSVQSEKETCISRLKILIRLRDKHKPKWFDRSLWTSFFCAAVMSAVGLASDSVVTLIGAMLISPLMNPVLQLTYAAADPYDDINGEDLMGPTLQFLASMAIAMSIGAAAAIFCHVTRFDALYEWPTKEMIGRCEPRNVAAAVGVATTAGVALANAIDVMDIHGDRGFGNDLVGVAIAASLLPPLVNTGMICTSVLWGWIARPPHHGRATHEGTPTAADHGGAPPALARATTEPVPGGAATGKTKRFLRPRDSAWSVALTMLTVSLLLASALVAFKYHLYEHFECQSRATPEELELAGIRSSSKTKLT